jgi:hypothetical protein
VLNGPDTGSHGVFDAVCRLCVGHDRQPGGGRLCHQRRQLVWPELGVLRAVARRQHATRRVHLDHVRPSADDLPHPLAHLLRPVHQPGRAAGMRRHQERHDSRRQPAVAVAAGLAQRADRDLQPWPVDEAILDGALHAEISSARVADCRDTAIQRCLQIARRLEELVREGALQPTYQIDPGNHHMYVTVEEAGQQGQAGHIDLLIPVQPAADLDDAPVRDHYIGVGYRTAGAVKDSPAAQYRPAHRPPPSLCRARSTLLAQGLPARGLPARNAIITYLLRAGAARGPYRWPRAGITGRPSGRPPG